MKYAFALFFLFATLCAHAAAPASVALAPGESLRFKVRWGIFGSAGEILVRARAEDVEGLPQIRITTHTSTRGLIRSLYLFDGDGESVFDGRDGRLLAISASSASNKKNTKTMAVFDYSAKSVNYVDYVRPERNLQMPLPSGNPMDLITCLIETRRWDLKPGDRIPATVVFDREFYDLEIVAQGYENVHTPMGDFKTLVLVPTMDKDPRGIFKRGGRVRVWISQDEKHLPVKFEVAMKFGTGTAVLAEYRPPTEGTEMANAYSSP